MLIIPFIQIHPFGARWAEEWEGMMVVMGDWLQMRKDRISNYAKDSGS